MTKTSSYAVNLSLSNYPSFSRDTVAVGGVSKFKIVNQNSMYDGVRASLTNVSEGRGKTRQILVQIEHPDGHIAKHKKLFADCSFCIIYYAFTELFLYWFPWCLFRVSSLVHLTYACTARVFILTDLNIIIYFEPISVIQHISLLFHMLS